MFRRRTTDQVYATLQQVQRRITEQGGNAPSPSAPPGAAGGIPAGARPLSSIAPRPLQTNQGLGSLLSSPSASPSNRPAAFPGSPPGDGGPQLPVPAPFLAGTPEYPRGTMQVPVPLAITVALLLFAMMAGFYYLGTMRNLRGDAAPVGAERAVEKPPEGKPLDAEATTQGKRQGDSLYVLKSVPSFNEQAKKQWQAEADRLNGVMQQNAAKGWKPYFGVREPENGGLQFVFGYANGQFGIDRVAFEDFARLLAGPTAKGGGGYTSAKWVPLE